MDCSRYEDLRIRRLEPGILEIVMGEEGGRLSTATARLHKEPADVWREARDLAYNVINCSKMIVSAMYGPEVQEGIASLREKRKPAFPPEPKDF